jgi:1-acyl-sn-glycerol-3-phosphate acyltransferase
LARVARRDESEGGDGLRPQVYGDPRPAESMRRAHEWARTHEPGWTYPAIRILLTPPALALYRCRAIGLEHIPSAGPVILAPNHFSNFDHFFIGLHLRRRIRFMTKSQLFAANRAVDYLFRVTGHFPVRRGHDDDEAFVTARSILARGGCVGIYAEGGRSRSGGLGEPRRGVGRLALETGVAVVPTAIHGSGDVRRWRRLRFPKVTVSYGKPLWLDRDPAPSRESQQAAAVRIFDRVRDLHTALDRA